MNAHKRTAAIALVLTPILFAGCILSGTFMITQPIDFSTSHGFYHVLVDITGQKAWADHKEDIDNIDMVGFDLWFDNPGTVADTFSCYIDDYNDVVLTDGATLNINTTKIINKLVVPAGKFHLTYGSSFKYLTNFDKLKTLVKSGKFHFYTVSTASLIRVDSGKVVVTFDAS